MTDYEWTDMERHRDETREAEALARRREVTLTDVLVYEAEMRDEEPTAAEIGLVAAELVSAHNASHAVLIAGYAERARRLLVALAGLRAAPSPVTAAGEDDESVRVLAQTLYREWCAGRRAGGVPVTPIEDWPLMVHSGAASPWIEQATELLETLRAPAPTAEEPTRAERLVDDYERVVMERSQISVFSTEARARNAAKHADIRGRLIAALGRASDGRSQPAPSPSEPPCQP